MKSGGDDNRIESLKTLAEIHAPWHGLVGRSNDIEQLALADGQQPVVYQAEQLLRVRQRERRKIRVDAFGHRRVHCAAKRKPRSGVDRIDRLYEVDQQVLPLALAAFREKQTGDVLAADDPRQ